MPAGALARNWSRCSTPNRCCSSTTTMPRLWNSTASCSSAWVPMTMPDLTAGDLGADLLLLRRRHRAGQQRHPGGVVGPAELAAHRQRTEHIADRPKMLCGKDFRRRQQRALVAGIDHLQHRQHRDDRLARADLTLQQPVHRPGRREFRRTARRAPRAAPRSARRATAATVPLPDRRIARGAGGPGFGQFAVPARHQRPLQPDGFVEGQPLPGARGARRRLRPDGWRAAPRLRSIRSCSAQQLFGQRVGHRVEDLEHLAHAGEDVPALQLGAGRIDREEAALERLTCSTSPLTACEASAIVCSDLLPRLRPSGESRIRKSGWVSCMAPRKYPTSPDSITLVPLVSSFVDVVRR